MFSKRDLLKSGAGLALASALAPGRAGAEIAETIASGPFKPEWESLKSQYLAPDWFRDAKFGIWAHWSAQCVPEAGDWYARNMYMEGSKQYQYHLQHYGHPSKFGFKDVIPTWKAEKFEGWP